MFEYFKDLLDIPEMDWEYKLIVILYGLFIIFLEISIFYKIKISIFYKIKIPIWEIIIYGCIIFLALMYFWDAVFHHECF